MSFWRVLACHDRIFFRNSKLTLDDTSTCLKVHLMTNYYDPLTNEKCNILIGGGHDICDPSTSAAHLKVDLSKDEGKRQVANFPDEKLSPHPIWHKNIHTTACSVALEMRWHCVWTCVLNLATRTYTHICIYNKYIYGSRSRLSTDTCACYSVSSIFHVFTRLVGRRLSGMLLCYVLSRLDTNAALIDVCDSPRMGFGQGTAESMLRLSGEVSS